MHKKFAKIVNYNVEYSRAFGLSSFLLYGKLCNKKHGEDHLKYHSCINKPPEKRKKNTNALIHFHWLPAADCTFFPPKQAQMEHLQYTGPSSAAD